jgi:kynureninase
MKYEFTLAFARRMDRNDKLRNFRSRFYFPVHKGKPVRYFCGNSLGLQPHEAEPALQQELNDWKRWAVEGHFKACHPWYDYHSFLKKDMAHVVGCHPSETTLMNSLTVNLHLMLVSFYRPTSQRYKILFDWMPFPSDRYALQSQVMFHGFHPQDALIELQADEKGYVSLDTVMETIEKNRQSLALVMIGGVNYYTGQYYNIAEITRAAHRIGALAGFDLAHAAGNVLLKLHDWQVDFAVWCSYKYLNAGPGSVGGIFVHEQHHNKSLPRFAGWWGNDPKTRFTMPETFIPVSGADGWQLSNAPVFSMAPLRASLKIFSQAGMKNLVAKSRLLTGYLEFIVHQINQKYQVIRLLTPCDEKERGCQLSLVLRKNGKKIYRYLADRGFITDWRQPDVIRVAPVPLYNSFEDVYHLGCVLHEAIEKYGQ